MHLKQISLFAYISLILFSSNLKSQDFNPLDIPFYVDENQKINALIGGLSAPQFMAFDLDGNEPIDLLIFERNGDFVLPFINKTQNGVLDYQYAPEYIEYFPEVRNFMQVHDFNDDGKDDIFTLAYAAPAIEVWRNTSTDSEISFEKMQFEGIGDFIQYKSNGNFTALYVSNIDIPAIVDYDGDGDFDVLNFDSGGSYINYYRNMVVENGMSKDTFAFRVEDKCWGKVFESGVGEEISLSDNVNQCAVGFSPGGNGGVRHAGSTILMFDGNGDGDMDALIGDLSNSGFVYLNNEPVDGKDFVVSQDLDFPSNDTEVDINIFLGAFLYDVDVDGVKDLVVAPNYYLGSENVDHIWFYKNEGTDANPTFELQQRDFLLNTTIVLGHSSYPEFFDYNNDGLLDLLIGTDGFIIGNNKFPSLILFENIGTMDNPEYSLVTDDYLGLKAVLTNNNGYLAPTVGDIDGDGDQDLIVGEKVGKLFYFENTAGPDQPVNFAPYIYDFQGIDVGTNVKPNIFDVNGDGLGDLIIGEKNDNISSINDLRGGLNFFLNQGDVGNPIFNSDVDAEYNTTAFGNIDTKDLTVTSGRTSPYFIESEGKIIGVVGSASGFLRAYDGVEGNLYGKFDTLMLELPITSNGRRTSPALADIDNDDYYEIVVGNDNGGIRMYNTTFRVVGGTAVSDYDEKEVTIFPNPTDDLLGILSEEVISEVKIYTMNGELVTELYPQSNLIELSTRHLDMGIYIAQIKIGDHVVTKKVSVLR